MNFNPLKAFPLFSYKFNVSLRGTVVVAPSLWQRINVIPNIAVLSRPKALCKCQMKPFFILVTVLNDFAFDHLKVGLPEFHVCVIPESIFIKQCLN